MYGELRTSPDSSDSSDSPGFQAAVKEILGHHAVRRADWKALRKLQALCQAADDATEDEYCRTKLHLIREYSAELLAHEDHCKWDCGTMSGAEFLRRQILTALELYCSRVYRLGGKAVRPDIAHRGVLRDDRIGL